MGGVEIIIDGVEIGDERRGGDRRARDRRAPRRRIDVLFAATLVNQVTPSAQARAAGYAGAQPAPRLGFVTNLRA
jgi:hypothetical protein